MTEKPYEYLYSLRNNIFNQSVEVRKMQMQAAELGFKGFLKMWKDYQKMKLLSGGFKIDNATCFTGQPLELLSGDYVCTDECITFFNKLGIECIVCPHPIMPIERLVNIDTGEERLKIAYKKGYVWRTAIVEKSVIASSNSILQLAAKGVVVNSENAKALSTYLLDIEQRNYEEIPETLSVSRLGWVESGFAPYVEGLTFDGEDNFKRIFNSVSTAGDFDKWVDFMRKVRKEGITARLVLAASFASVLIDPCGLLPFFLHLWGTTEQGKTVSLLLAASVWANPQMGEYITTFNSTAVGQEMTASFLNSLPMCIDELQIKSSEGVKDFDKMIYQLTEGIGKTRGTKTGGLQKQNTWKNCFITSGEQPITNPHSNGGAVNRIIEVEYQELLYHNLVELADFVKQNYGHAGKAFVEYLQQDGVLDEVRQIQKGYYKQLLNTDSTDKQAASMSAILTADKFATDLFFKDDLNLTVNDVSSIMAKKKDVDANRRAHEYALSLIETHAFNFIRKDGEVKGEIWGCIEYGEVYILKTIFDREMSAAGYNSTAFLSWAKRNGKIRCDSDGRNTKKKRISEISGKDQPRCVCFVTDSTFEPIDDDDLPI